MKASNLQAGKGKGRDYEAIQKHIHNLPYENGRPYTVAAVARLAKVSYGIAWDTIRGTKNNAKVLDKLQELGVSEEMLFPQKSEVQA